MKIRPLFFYLSMENATRAFLGAEYNWDKAQIELDDVQALYGGVRLWIASWGKPSVRRVAAGGKEKRYKIPFSRDEKKDLLNLFVAQDFLTIEPEEREGIPDEARPSITLTNYKWDVHVVSKWAGVQDERFDVLYDALLTIADRSKNVIKSEPEPLRPYQKIGIIIGLILLVIAPFLLGNLLARGLVGTWWPEQIGRLIGGIPLLAVGILLLVAGLYWWERDKPKREQRFTDSLLWVIVAIFLMLSFFGWMGLLQKGMMLRWAETAVGTVTELNHRTVPNSEYGWDDFYDVGVTFDTELGAEINTVMSVGRPYFDTLAVNTAVTVYYLPFLPRVSMLAESVQSPGTAVFAYTCLFAIYFIIAIWGLWAQKIGRFVDKHF